MKYSGTGPWYSETVGAPLSSLPDTDLTKTGNNFYGVKLYSQGRELAQSKVSSVAATVIRGKFYVVNTNLLT